MNAYSYQKYAAKFESVFKNAVATKQQNLFFIFERRGKVKSIQL